MSSDLSGGLTLYLPECLADCFFRAEKKKQERITGNSSIENFRPFVVPFQFALLCDFRQNIGLESFDSDEAAEPTSLLGVRNGTAIIQESQSCPFFSSSLS